MNVSKERILQNQNAMKQVKKKDVKMIKINNNALKTKQKNALKKKKKKKKPEK